MKRIVKKIVTFQCETCRTEHPSKKEAQKCESLPKEKKAAKIGTRIRIKEERECGKYGFPGKRYAAVGRVLKVLPLSPAIRWPGYELKKHEHTYLCKWKCPHCGEFREQEFNSSEFTVLTNATTGSRGKRAG